MEQFDLLIKNGTILKMDEANTLIENGYIGIRGSSILTIGSGESPAGRARKEIDARGGIILPGLVNAHTHAAMALFRGLADDLPLMEWLNRYIFPVERRMDADFVYSGTLLACAEMILSGTTCFCDMYLFEESVARAAKEAGMRALVGEVLYDFDSPNYGTVEKGLAYSESLITQWENDPLVSIAVEPHSLFTCSPGLLTASRDLAIKYHVPLVLHLAETLAELDEIKNRYGCSPVEHLENLGLLGPHLIADHCIHLREKEIELLAEKGVSGVHNPESNMKLASGVAPVPQMLAKNMTLGLGTDGCASNNNLDLFVEMDMAAKLHKVNMMDATVMDARTVLRMATIEGARALGLGHLTGSIEEGKKADIIIIDTNKPHLTPLYHPQSHLVYAARGNDVSHSIINGTLVMDDRKLLTLDLEAVMERARMKASNVRRWLAESLGGVSA